MKTSIPFLSHTVQQVQQESVQAVLSMNWLLRHLVATGMEMELMGVLQCVRTKQCTRFHLFLILRMRIFSHVRLDKRSGQVPDIFLILQKMSSLLWRDLQSHYIASHTFFLLIMVLLIWRIKKIKNVNFCKWSLLYLATDMKRG